VAGHAVASGIIQRRGLTHLSGPHRPFERPSATPTLSYSFALSSSSATRT
jgi:hypothetical protein